MISFEEILHDSVTVLHIESEIILLYSEYTYLEQTDATLAIDIPQNYST